MNNIPLFDHNKTYKVGDIVRFQDAIKIFTKYDNCCNWEWEDLNNANIAIPTLELNQPFNFNGSTFILEADEIESPDEQGKCQLILNAVSKEPMYEIGIGGWVKMDLMSIDLGHRLQELNERQVELLKIIANDLQHHNSMQKGKEFLLKELYQQALEDYDSCHESEKEVELFYLLALEKVLVKNGIDPKEIK